MDVSIIVPYKNDSVLVGWACRAFFAELLEAGVKIYQFKDGLLHTKSVLVDGQLSLVGTVNLDMRSLWLNFEITIVIDDAGFGSDLPAYRRIILPARRCWTRRSGKTGLTGSGWWSGCFTFQPLAINARFLVF